ncbi:hypothetical protein EV182_002519 [Spiromyces aspiralis]|uniref:Uncharacterized protein n=1 Tax=Spiromyces aspiralis TaxID=68401 RepID=A0ACC1HEP0_9FUNG|nr:hypothetical protein EV182_002519 [Spiromyces aspiralis]
MTSLHHLFIPKNRLAIFDVSLGIIDLTNMPLTVGRFYTKYRLQHDSSTTPKREIRQHSVYWNYWQQHRVEIVVGKDGMLSPCVLTVKIRMESRTGNATMGVLRLNISQFASLTDVFTRRYLLEESKVNSTIKIAVKMALREDCDPFRTPPINRKQFLSEVDEIVPEIPYAPTQEVSSTAGNSRSSRTTSIQQSGFPTTLSNGESRSFLPIDDSDLEDLAPFKCTSKRNEDIVNDIFTKPSQRQYAVSSPHHISASAPPTTTTSAAAVTASAAITTPSSPNVSL